MLGEIPGVSLVEPEGAFYCWASVTGLIGTEIGGQQVKTSEELAAALLEVAEIAIVPGEAFGAPGYLRLSFALSDEDLEEGLTRFRNAVG
jgi:aspartate/methionine/tyrosine aminotransferase